MTHQTILRAMICTLSILASLAIYSLAGAAVKVDGIVLAVKGKPLCQIVVSVNATENEKTAASDLSKYLGKVIGIAPRITTEPAGGNLVGLYVGQTSKANETAAADIAGLGADGIVIKSSGNDIVLTGNGPRGIIYAVDTFLEDVIGCKWYAVDADEVVPSKPNLTVPIQNVVYTPPFEYRLIYTEAVRDPMMRVRLRLNGTDNFDPAPDNYGGGFSFGGGHSLIGQFMKPADYYEKHPEWYAYRKAENKRIPSQLCLTNPEARQAAAAEVIAYLSKTHSRFVSVGPADTDAVCQCENCTAISEREGAYSGVLLDFVNYVAEQVEKQFPYVTISTLSYWSTERPPKYIKPRKNVMIIFAVLDRNHKHDISKVPNYSRYLDEWQKMSSSVYMWDYDPHFGNFIQPHPNHTVLGNSIKFYKKMNVKGVFSQGSWGSAGEFMHMRAWVNAHMMWNPDLDPHTLMAEFTSAYYGKAGPILLKYIDLIDKAVNRQPDTWLGVYGSDTSNWFTLDDITASTKLFNQAEKAVAKNKTLLYRVRRARLSIEVVYLQRYRELRYEAERRKVAFLGPQDLYVALENFSKNEFGVNCYKEWDDLTGYRRVLDDMLFPPSGTAPEQCAKLKSYQWVDVRNDLIKATDAVEATQSDDPVASDGKALVLKGSNVAMQATYELPRNLAGKWRVYVTLRSKPAGDAKVGVAVGIYAPSELFRTTAEFDSESGKSYKTIDMGEFQLGESAKIWVQPNGSGSFGQKEATWIDRIFLVHVK